VPLKALHTFNNKVKVGSNCWT